VRTTLFLVVVLLTAAAWFLTYSNVQNMGLMMQLGVPMSLGMEGSAGVASFIAFTGMWLVMMIAMMLPSTYPTLLLHRTVYRKRTPNRPAGSFLFASSYFLVWTAAGTFFYAGYVAIGRLRAEMPASETAVLRMAGVALLLSGLYQWTPLKWSCLRHCQNPLHFVTEHWHDGPLGAVRMGAAHAVYCVGCCWGVMVILFVMGVMHLGWMAAIGALILFEKVVPSAKWIPYTIGFVFSGVGAIVILFPDVLSRLSSQVVLPH
jgi:predicted metal-binding membrane protein